MAEALQVSGICEQRPAAFVIPNVVNIRSPDALAFLGTLPAERLVHQVFPAQHLPVVRSVHPAPRFAFLAAFYRFRLVILAVSGIRQDIAPRVPARP